VVQTLEPTLVKDASALVLIHRVAPHWAVIVRVAIAAKAVVVAAVTAAWAVAVVVSAWRVPVAWVAAAAACSASRVETAWVAGWVAAAIAAVHLLRWAAAWAADVPVA
jgi:hypothetical protein